MLKLKKLLQFDKKIENLFKRKNKKKKRKNLTRKQKIITSIIIIALLSFLFYFSGILKPICYTEECFDKAFQTCKPVKHTKLTSNNIYQYKISRSLFKTCKIEITMKKTAPGTDLDIKESIEGKSMKCKIPKYLIKETRPAEFENLINYCTGPLKEGIYELMLKKTYGLVVANMGDIVQEIQRTLKSSDYIWRPVSYCMTRLSDFNFLNL